MKLSDKTISLLKNFSSINANLVIQPGSTIKTIAEAKNIFASAEVEEEFENEIGIYDLGEFLSVVSMFNDPELVFDDKFVTFKEGRRSLKYFFADSSILTYPQKDIKMPSTDVTFTLTADDMSNIRKASSTLGLMDLVVSCKDGNVVLTVTDTKNPTTNSFDTVLDSVSCDSDFSIVFNINNLRFAAGDYDVEVSSKLLAKFINTQQPLEYFVALEKNSTFGV